MVLLYKSAQPIHTAGKTAITHNIFILNHRSLNIHAADLKICTLLVNPLAVQIERLTVEFLYKYIKHASWKMLNKCEYEKHSKHYYILAI